MSLSLLYLFIHCCFVQEFTYDAILSTPSLTSSLVTVNIGGRVTSLMETLETTLWRADTVTETVTPAPVTPQPLPSPVAGPGVGQISQIIQNVLLSLIGGGLLGGKSQSLSKTSNHAVHCLTIEMR